MAKTHSLPHCKKMFRTDFRSSQCCLGFEISRSQFLWVSVGCADKTSLIHGGHKTPSGVLKRPCLDRYEMFWQHIIYIKCDLCLLFLKNYFLFICCHLKVKHTSLSRYGSRIWPNKTSSREGHGNADSGYISVFMGGLHAAESGLCCE